MAKIVKVENPKVWAIDVSGNDGFSITFTQKVNFKLFRPVQEGETYLTDWREKRKKTPIQTEEYEEIVKLLEGGRMFFVIVPPKEEGER